MSTALRLVSMTEKDTLLSAARAIVRRPDRHDDATLRVAARTLIARGDWIDDRRGCALLDQLDREADARAQAGTPDPVTPKELAEDSLGLFLTLVGICGVLLILMCFGRLP